MAKKEDTGAAQHFAQGDVAMRTLMPDADRMYKRKPVREGLNKAVLFPAVRVSLIYTIAGVLWIVVSDKLLLSMVSDPHTITILQTYKGWAFVLASSLLIYHFLIRELRGRMQAEESLGIALEAARFGYWDLDLVENRTHRSIRHDQIFGYQSLQPEWNHEIFLKHVLPEDRVHVAECFSRALAQGDLTLDCRIRWPDQTTHWIECRGRAYLGKDGRPVRVVGVVTDATERKRADEALRESEEKFSTAFRSAPNSMMISSLEDGTVIEVNDEFVAAYGFERSEVLGKTAVELGIWKDADERSSWLQQVKSKGYARNVDLSFATKDGRLRHGLLSTVTVQLQGKPFLLNTFNDITERKVAEEALRDSEERLRLSWDTIPDALSITQMGDGTYVDVNNGFTMVSGYSREEALGKSSVDIPIWPDPQARQLFVSCLKRDGHVKNFEAKLRRRAGEPRTFLVSASQMTLSGEPHILALARDVEEFYQTAEALRASEEKYRNIFNNCIEGMFQTNPDGRVISANPALARMFGYPSPEEMISDVTDLGRQLYATHQDREEVTRRLDDGVPVTGYQVELCGRDGSNFWVSMNARLVRDENGNVLYYEGTMEDITDRKRAQEELAKSEELLKAILDASPVGIALVRNRKVEWANSTVYDLFGYVPDDIQEADVRQFYMSHDDYQRTGDTLYANLTKGEVRETEVFCKRRNGITFPCLIRVTMIEDEPGNHTIIAVFMDITERKMSEESIRIRLNLLEFAASHSLDELLQKTLDEITALTSSPIGFYHFVESDQKILSLQAWSTQTVMEFCTAKGKGQHYPIDQAGVWADCIHERRPVIHNDYSSLPHRKGMPEGHAAVSRELVVPIIKSDRIVAVLGIGNKPTDYTEKDVEICSYLADVAWEVAERKRAEEALKESEQRYRSLFEESRDGVYSVLRDGEITDANRSFCELFGYTKEEMIGEDIRELYSDPADHLKFQQEIEAKGFVQDYEVKWQKRGGTSMDCLLTSSTIFGSNGNILGYRGIVRDVTDRKVLQHQLLQAQKMEAIGTLAGGIAHDFNNLLQVVLGFSELLLAEKDEKHPDYADLRKIFHAARNGAGLVQRLLMFSRKSEPKTVPMNLNKQVLQIEKLLRRTIPKMVDISLDLSPDLPAINADPSQVEQVLMNLAVNARDAMPDVGKLTVKTSIVPLDEEYCRLHLEATPGEYVLLEVSDTGHGMDKETLEHLFEPFFTTKEVGRGTGLGLAMVYGIVKQHNGHITVYSEIGKGTTFRLYFPTIPADEEPEEEITGVMPAFGTETVLLVDDEEFVRELGARILTKYGYTVLLAENGREALDLFTKKRTEISLVILDLIMPEMGGTECLKKLLKIDAHVNVLVASGFSADASLKEMMQMGAKGFASKPFRVRELLREIRRILDKG